jgi:plastocyanin
MRRSARLALRLGVAAVSSAAVVTACSSSKDDNSASPPPAATSAASTPAGEASTPPAAEISTAPASEAPGSTTSTKADLVIKNFAFSPAGATFKVGQTVTVVNEDGVEHTLTARDMSFNSGDLEDGKSGTITFKKAGTFQIYCKYHSNMSGTVTVTA